MSNRPQVTVIVGSYNRPWMLAECLKSVLAQEDVDWECVVSDDGSTEDTRSAVPDDPRFRYIAGDHCGHLSMVKNRGICEAQGKYIAFLDDDDMFTPGSLDFRMRMLTNESEMAFVGGAAIIVGQLMTYEYGVMIADSPKLPIHFRTVTWPDKPWLAVHSGTVIVHRAVIEHYGIFDPHPAMHIGQDRELWARWCMQGVKLIRCNKPAAFWRVHGGQRTHARTKEQRDQKNAYRARILKERAECMTPENTPMLSLARQ